MKQEKRVKQIGSAPESRKAIVWLKEFKVYCVAIVIINLVRKLTFC